jgi:hypothetical protein
MSQNVRYYERAYQKEKGEWNQQLIDLALYESSKALICLENATRQEKKERHSKCIEEVVKRKTRIIEQRQMKTHDQCNTDSLGQIDVFNSRFLDYRILRHNQLLIVIC